ncbi:nucleotidyltransferase domain-containing protein [Candidatus Pacearchaeota archaeon]|nr:nucleotidyltransferase domain-containing protein [Candidatus Pacearchaeota archaeon]
MSLHRKIALEACDEIKKLPEVIKILLFGTVSIAKEREDSDIDLAVIFGDEYRLFLTDCFEGLPLYGMEEIKKIRKRLAEKSGIKIDITPLYESEFNRGIKLKGTKYAYEDILNEVGKVLYDFWDSN